ncbi:Hypothetical predicted protein, partial [Marmota monax]
VPLGLFTRLLSKLASWGYFKKQMKALIESTAVNPQSEAGEAVLKGSVIDTVQVISYV